jgi:hypothetical protein
MPRPLRAPPPPGLWGVAWRGAAWCGVVQTGMRACLQAVRRQCRAVTRLQVAYVRTQLEAAWGGPAAHGRCWPPRHTTHTQHPAPLTLCDHDVLPALQHGGAYLRALCVERICQLRALGGSHLHHDTGQNAHAQAPVDAWRERARLLQETGQAAAQQRTATRRAGPARHTHLAQALQHCRVALVVAVAEVEARHVHARVDQRRQAGLVPAGGAERAHNLGLAHHLHLLRVCVCVCATCACVFGGRGAGCGQMYLAASAGPLSAAQRLAVRANTCTAPLHTRVGCPAATPADRRSQ